jgi:hypothetical protein
MLASVSPVLNQRSTNLIPGEDVLRMSLVLRQTPIQLILEAGRQRKGLRDLGEAVPNVFDQLDPFCHTQLADLV